LCEQGKKCYSIDIYGNKLGEDSIKPKEEDEVLFEETKATYNSEESD